MNIIFVLHLNIAFSDALEGVASKNFSLALLAFQLLTYSSYKILHALVCSQQLNFLGAFTFTLFLYSQS